MESDHSLDHEDRSALVISVVTLCLVSITAAVAARVYTRVVILNTFGPDDYAAAVSLVFTIACGLIIAIMVNYGSGKHIWTLQPSEIQQYLMNFYLSIVFYNASIMATKASFLLQYYRVLAVNQFIKRIYLGFLILIASWCFAFVLIAIFQCTPISDFWSLEPTRNCIPNFPYWHIQAGGHIVTDILVFTLPLPALYQLRINATQKLVLMGIFSLGFFACAISVIRLRYLNVAQDVTWDNAVPSSWSIAEISIGLLCACLPTLRPLVGRVFPNLISTLHASAGGRGGPSKGYIHYGTGTSGSKSGGGGGVVGKSRGLAPSAFSTSSAGYHEQVSVERVHMDDKGSETRSFGKDGILLDDSSETRSNRGFHMATFGTKTRVTTGPQVHTSHSGEPSSLPAGRIRVYRDIYQTQV